MFLIVLGAGAIGKSLIELALEKGHQVTLIERNPERAKAAAEHLDIRIIHGDIAMGGILEEAGVEKADALIGTSGDDASNLMAMFLGREHKVPTLITIVNHKGHEKMFERLGAKILVDPEVLIAKHLFGMLEQPTLESVFPLPHGAQVFEVVIGPEAKIADLTLGEAGAQKILPNDLLILWIQAGEDYRIPHGKTVLHPGDRIAVFTNRTVPPDELKIFTG
ncbi:MAG TPA: TrkA family potassium uptake protein [Planctomycetes bacterium]|nr:TrkA family potassium uptake protein [Planctomycetota bacterium]